MRKINNSVKRFWLRQILSYGLGSIVIGTSIGIPASFIAKAKGRSFSLRDRVKRASHDETYFMKSGIHPKQELFLKSKDGFKVNKGILKSFEGWKPFGVRTPNDKELDDEIPFSNPKKYNQMYLWNVNGIRMWSSEMESLNNEVALSQDFPEDKKHLSKDYLTNTLSKKTFDSFMSDLQKELFELPSSYLGSSAINFKIIPYILEDTSYQSRHDIAVGRWGPFHTSFLNILTFAWESITRFIFERFNPVLEKGESNLSQNQKIAQKLTAVPNSFVPGLVSRAGGSPTFLGIKKFLDVIKKSGVLDINMDGKYTGNTFGEYLYKAMIQNAKFVIQRNLMKKLYQLSTPIKRDFIKNNKKLSQFQENNFKEYELVGGNLGWNHNHYAHNINTAKVILPKAAKESVENLFLRGVKNKRIDIKDIKTINNVPPYFISKRYSWDKQIESYSNKKYNPIVNSFEIPKGGYNSSRSFFWRTNKDRWFVKNRISDLKISIENRISIKDKKIIEKISSSNGFSITTNDDAYFKFKEYMKKNGGFSSLPKNTRNNLFDMPPKAIPSAFEGSNPDSWEFDDAKKVIKATLQIPISYYIAVIKSIIEKSKKSEAIEIIQKSMWVENSSLRFNSAKELLKKYKDDKNPSNNTFSFFNKKNIKKIVNKIWEQMTEKDGIKAKKSIFGNSVEKGDFAAAERCFMKHVSKKIEVEKKSDGYFSSNVLEEFLKSPLSLFQIDKNGNLLKRDTAYINNKLFFNSPFYFESNITNMLTIATIMSSKKSVLFSSTLEHWINYYVAQGFEILNSKKNGLSDKIIRFAKELLTVLNRADKMIAFGKTISIYKQYLNYQGYTIIGYTDKEVSYIKIQDNLKIKTFKSPTKIYVFSKPGEKSYIKSLKNKKAFFTRAVRIGDYKDSQLIRKSNMEQSFKITAFDKFDKKIILKSVNSRPPIGATGEISFSTVLGLMKYAKDKKDVFIETFKNAKGL